MNNNKDNILITLALPAYNEESNILKVLNDSISSLNSIEPLWEIIVIDNNSNDKTASIVTKFAANEPRISIISHRENLLYSGSCITALNNAKGDYVAIMDSDGQFVASDIPRFFKKLKAGANFVNGWRRKRKDPISRLIASTIFNIMGRFWLRFPLHDLNCGIRMFDRKFIKVAKIEHKINMVNPEFYVRAKLAGLNIDEVEIKHQERLGGKTSHNFSKSLELFLLVNRYMKSLHNELKDFSSRTK